MVTIKIAETSREYEQIHDLNYQTFVEEIKQHEPREDKRLEDQFHDLNNYVIACFDNQLIGMVCYKTKRPFSLDKKGVSIDAYITAEEKIAEVRLLTILPKWRKGKVTFRLLKFLISEMLSEEIELAFVSAKQSELSFYHKLGFVSFGDIVGKEGAWYQPMFVKLETLNPKLLS
ncbi:MAG: GNAT family N-acetyltransferase [Vicingaceae bacterium]